MATEVHVFPDTNVLLHFPALDGLDWKTLCAAQEVVLHISQPLLIELNKIKEIGGTKSVRKRAATVQRRLAQLFDEHGITAPLAPSVEIVFEEKNPDMRVYPDLNPSVLDDVLVAAVLGFLSREGKSAVLVTDDNGLALRIKAVKRELKVLRPPDSARLKDEPDEDEKEKEKLRRRIASLEQAAPTPKLFFSNGSSILKIDAQKIDIEAEVTAALEKMKNKYPPLPEPKDPKPKLSGPMTLGRLAAMNLSYGDLLRSDPKEVNKYNDALGAYLADFENITRRNLQIRQRLLRLELQVDNSNGFAPALDVLVEMHFPDGLRVIEKGKSKRVFQSLPEAPLMPGHVRGFQDHLTSLTRLPLVRPVILNAPTMSIKKTKQLRSPLA